jgi:hypothetical protein
MGQHSSTPTTATNPEVPRLKALRKGSRARGRIGSPVVPSSRLTSLRPTKAGLSVAELWVACYSLGGMASEGELAGFLDGSRVPTRAEYEVVAQAINERFTEIGQDHPVPYAEDL